MSAATDDEAGPKLGRFKLPFRKIMFTVIAAAHMVFIPKMAVAAVGASSYVGASFPLFSDVGLLKNILSDGP